MYSSAVQQIKRVDPRNIEVRDVRHLNPHLNLTPHGLEPARFRGVWAGAIFPFVM